MEWLQRGSRVSLIVVVVVAVIAVGCGPTRGPLRYGAPYFCLALSWILSSVNT
jgi:hypothetical protein